MGKIQAVVFDWGDTLMRDFAGYDGPMVSWPVVEAMPGAADALADLAGRYTLCVASNAGASDSALMGQALERAGLRRGLTHLFTSKELGAAKPDPAFFRAICERIGLPPEACLMVGNDYRKDIAGAAAAGLRTVWLVSDGPAPGAAGDAHGIIRSLDELPAAVERLDADA